MSSHDEAPAGTGASSENFRQDSVDHLSDAHQTWAEWQVNEARRPRVSRKVTLTPASEIMNRPDPNFLIDGVLEEGGFGMIYSAPGLGKTFVVLSWLMAIARGEPWLGREVLQGPVVYVSAEGVGGLGKRLRAMCHDLKIKEPPSNFYVIDSPVDLMDPYSMADAIEAAHALKVRPRLIVFDTFARSLVGGDENSAKDVSLSIFHLDALRRDLGTSALVVHHTVKSVPKSGLASERGSGALEGGLDTKIILTGRGRDLVLTVQKQKNFLEVDPIPLELVPVAESLVIRGRHGGFAPATTVLQPDDKVAALQEAIHAALAAADERGDTPIGQTGLLNGVIGNNGDKIQILKSMADNPESPVIREDKGRSIVYSLRSDSDSIPPTP